MSESVLRYHDQIAGQTITISKYKEDLVKEQKSKCALEERLAKAGTQTTRLDEEIIQLKAMSNVNCCLRFIIICDILNLNLWSYLGICSFTRRTSQIERQIQRTGTSSRGASWSVEKRNTEI